MTTKNQRMQSIMRLYREQTGESSITMPEVAKFAVSKGWKLPTPRTALDLLAEQFSAAAREETRRDKTTGRPYRANLAVTTWVAGTQTTFWYDIEEAPRHVAHKSFNARREQMVGEAVQLSLDIDHWNRVNPEVMPIHMPNDLTPDVEWRMNSPDDDEAAQAA